MPKNWPQPWGVGAALALSPNIKQTDSVADPAGAVCPGSPFRATPPVLSLPLSYPPNGDIHRQIREAIERRDRGEPL
ncbi:MAG: hypothetical protein R2860_12975 [Desulfobacterales bacterium]